MKRFVLSVVMLLCSPAAWAETTWNPASCQLILSGKQLTVTSTTSMSPLGCRTTSSKSSGLVYWQLQFEGFEPSNWQGGLADGTWPLTAMVSPNGTYAYPAGSVLALNVGGSTLCANAGVISPGTVVEFAADLTNRKIDVRRLNDSNWCVSGGPQPNQGAGGVGTINGTVPWYISFLALNTGNGATLLLGTGNLPTGYSYWDFPPPPPPDFVAVTNAQRYPGNPIMTHNDFPWSANGQLCCTTILDDPTDPRKLVMYIVAWTPDPYCCGTPVRLEGLRSNPYTSWNLSSTADKVVDGITLGKATQVLTMTQPWEQFIWVGSVFLRKDVTPNMYYMYYTGNQNAAPAAAIGVATSTDGKVWTKYAGNPIFKTAGNETHVGNPFVWYENGQFTLIFSYRIPGRVLPGYKCAVSSDGTNFSRNCPSANPGSDIYSCTGSIHCEVVGIIKVQDAYLLYSEQGWRYRRYRHEIAQSDSGLVTGPYRNLATSPMFRGSIDQDGVYGTWDQFHVATAFLYHSTPPGPDGWILYYQGGGQYDIPGSPLNPPGFENADYELNNWKIGAASIDLAYLGSGQGGVALLPAGIGRSSMGLRR